MGSIFQNIASATTRIMKRLGSDYLTLAGFESKSYHYELIDRSKLLIFHIFLILLIFL